MDVSSAPLLSIVMFLPLVGAVIIGCLNPEAKDNVRWVALWTTIVTFLVSLIVWFNFDSSTASFQFVEQRRWLDVFKFKLGVDGISVLFVILTTFLLPLCVLSSWVVIQDRVKEYMIAFLVLETLMIGVFCALDLILFYVFFEGGLIPMFLIIGIWGGPRRVYATFKFFLYTLLGSVLMLLAIIAMYRYAGTTDIPTLMTTKFPADMQWWLWFAFFASFAVKLPMWPVHTWLPDAHVEAPTAGSVILAAILLKMGAYGFLRFSLPMFPLASEQLTGMMFFLSVVAIIYASLVALAQTDMKKLIAYSSVAHMGFVTLGIFTFSTQGLEGAVFQMVSHGIISAGLFLCVGVLYDRLHTHEIAAFGGLVNRMPLYAAFFMVFTLGNVGLPGTSGFIGEFLTLLAAFKANTWVAFLATTGVILSASYALWLYRRVIFGTLVKPALKSIQDLTYREIGILAPLVALTILLGFYPAPVLDVAAVSVKKLVGAYEASVRPAPAAPAASPAPAAPSRLACACARTMSFWSSGPMQELTAYLPVLPEIVIALGAMALLMFGAFRRASGGRDFSATVIAILFLLAAAALVATGPVPHAPLFQGAFLVDGFARFMKLLVLAGAVLVLLMSFGDLARTRLLSFEYAVLLLLSVLGMMLMVSAGDLIALFLGVELQSLALYVIAAIRRDSVRSSEAGLKYFVLGSLSTGMLLYGCSLIYGFTGSIDFPAIAAAAKGLSPAESAGLSLGLVFLLVGIAFKIAAVPFHMWTPDVYEGAPTPVTAFFSAAPKIAGMALLIRVVIEAFPALDGQWQQILVFLSIASMLLGAFAAIGQSNIKRLMAYSSIGHVGYALIGLAADSEAGTQAVIVYLAIYLFMTVGTFACILSMRTKDGMVEDIDALSGLANTNLPMAFVLAVMLFSMAGIPPLAGFFAKLYVFSAAIDSGLVGLAVIGVLASVVAAYYYLRVVKIMFFDEAHVPFLPVERGPGFVMAVSALFVLLFIIVPAPLVDAALAAAQSLASGR